MQLQELLQKTSSPGGKALADAEISKLLALLPGWERVGHEIVKTYNFKNYYETLAFVNALAYVAHHEDHHPDMGVHYNRCKVAFSTHDAGGITLNDFICAAKIERLQTR
jgi:4a-hydroxytetrahydrobiopterin dehydratase